MLPPALEFERPIAELEQRIEELRAVEGVDLSEEIRRLEEKLLKLKEEIYGNLSAWQRTQLARHPQRPYTLDYISLIATEFQELAGDRCFADDKAIVGGPARIDGRPVMLIGHQKGRDTKEKLARNFGMPHPEGFRKAMRLMKLAERFGMPVVTMIDTAGAYPGVGAEERGQAEAIARNLYVMAALRVPIIACVLSEGGSGGALAIGVGNRVLMLSNAVYFVCSPEACSAILFKDAGKASEAAEVMCITASDLMRLGVVDEIVEEPLGGAHKDPALTAARLKEALLRHLDELSCLGPEAIVAQRYERFRRMGQFVEAEGSAGQATGSTGTGQSTGESAGGNAR